MTKKPKSRRNNDDPLSAAIASIVVAALRDKLPELMPVSFLVSAEDMELLFKMGRIYEHYDKKDITVDAELRKKTAEALAMIFHGAKPLSQEHTDMLVEGVELLQKKTEDMKNSAEWEDKHIASKQYTNA